MAPANAIFGLSTCEKVKKQVLAYEERIDEISNYWRSYKGEFIPRALGKKFKSQSNPKNDVVIKLTKIQFNNPKCFTRTQNEQINARKSEGWDFGYFVQYRMFPVLRNLKQCKLLFQTLDPSDECLIHYDYEINETYSIPTIYES